MCTVFTKTSVFIEELAHAVFTKVRQVLTSVHNVFTIARQAVTSEHNVFTKARQAVTSEHNVFTKARQAMMSVHNVHDGEPFTDQCAQCSRGRDRQ